MNMNPSTSTENMSADKQQLIKRIQDNVIGDQALIETPFGLRKMTYADYTASGRSLAFIETLVQQQVLPFYANTHTEATASGKQTTRFREDARQIIRSAVKANADDLVIFCGAGATAAINKLICMMDLAAYANTEKTKRPVIFIGPYEHHSNELPWREAKLEVVRIPENQCGGLDLLALENALIQYKEAPLKIGSFSAASNVTGIKLDQDKVTQLLHAHNALSFWDFAAAAPYVDIAMNPDPVTTGLTNKDAIFFSCHKFIGGPGTPGILVVKKNLVTNALPSTIGGGTVSFVTPSQHTYLPVGERREEGGTPGIVESIRAGLVFKLKQEIGCDTIEHLENALVEKIEQRWRSHPNIQLLGAPTHDRLTITSLRIKTVQGYLHHGFVVAVLNDFFGIQVRGGCSCAGPYGHQLLNITHASSCDIETAVAQGNKLLKPGWVRFNLNYFLREEEANFILDAIEFVAEHGLSILPYYEYETASDLWLFQGQTPTTKRLQDLCWDSLDALEANHKDDNKALWQSYLAQAHDIVKAMEHSDYRVCQQAFNPDFNQLRDFVLVQDIA